MHAVVRNLNSKHLHSKNASSFQISNYTVVLLLLLFCFSVMLDVSVSMAAQWFCLKISALNVENHIY